MNFLLLMIALSLIKTVSSFHSKRAIAKDFTLKMSTTKVHKKVHVLVPIGIYNVIRLNLQLIEMSLCFFKADGTEELEATTIIDTLVRGGAVS